MSETLHFVEIVNGNEQGRRLSLDGAQHVLLSHDAPVAAPALGAYGNE